MLFCIHKVVREDRRVMLMLMITLAILIVTPHISSKYTMLAYAQYSVSITCGPTQDSHLSVSMSISEFLPKSFIDYKFIRPDNSVVSGGFSTGPYGKNTVSINVGPESGSYLVYIYKDTNSSSTEQQPIYYSTFTLPCADNYFTGEYYKSHPQLIEYLLGIQSIYNNIKIGDYLVASPRNALEILNSANSTFAEDQLAAQLVAAELNVAAGGASNCIGEAIYSANALLKSQSYNGPTNILRTSMSEDLHTQMLSYKDMLETYNRVGCGR